MVATPTRVPSRLNPRGDKNVSKLNVLFFSYILVLIFLIFIMIIYNFHLRIYIIIIIIILINLIEC